MPTHRTMSRWVCGLVLVTVIEGCQTTRSGARDDWLHREPSKRIRHVHCLYDQKPWLNLDRAGDRDPEGICYRVYLDPGSGRGILAEGTFHVEMYEINRLPDGKVERTLVSDWHYPTSKVHSIAKAGMLGDGYFLHLMWASKEIAGKEIEIITEFEDADGHRARSGNKRFRVPRYAT